MSKTPFELRLDSLYLARDILASEYDAAFTRLNSLPDENERATEINKLKYPTIEEIYKRANELRSFVDGKVLDEEKQVTLRDFLDCFDLYLADDAPVDLIEIGYVEKSTGQRGRPFLVGKQPKEEEVIDDPMMPPLWALGHMPLEWGPLPGVGPNWGWLLERGYIERNTNPGPHFQQIRITKKGLDILAARTPGAAALSVMPLEGVTARKR